MRARFCPFPTPGALRKPAKIFQVPNEFSYRASFEFSLKYFFFFFKSSSKPGETDESSKRGAVFKFWNVSKIFHWIKRSRLAFKLAARTAKRTTKIRGTCRSFGDPVQSPTAKVQPSVLIYLVVFFLFFTQLKSSNKRAPDKERGESLFNLHLMT